MRRSRRDMLIVLGALLLLVGVAVVWLKPFSWDGSGGDEPGVAAQGSVRPTRATLGGPAHGTAPDPKAQPGTLPSPVAAESARDAAWTVTGRVVECGGSPGEGAAVFHRL